MVAGGPKHLSAGVQGASGQSFDLSFRQCRGVAHNLDAPHLYEEAVRRGEAVIARGGALVAQTGAHTGRSPKDKFVVADPLTEGSVWWGNNGRMGQAQFDRLLADMIEHARGKQLYAQDLFGGADPAFCVKTRVYTELAWHSLFIRNMLIRPAPEELRSFVPELAIIDLPSFKADPARHGCRSDLFEDHFMVAARIHYRQLSPINNKVAVSFKIAHH